MAAVIVSDYFYGDESKEFSYFRIPRLLITHQRFKNISVEAKLPSMPSWQKSRSTTEWLKSFGSQKA